MAQIVVIGTCDTKLEELLFLRSQILSQGDTEVLLIDAGRSPTTHPDISISHQDLLSHHGPGQTKQDLSSLPRGEVIKLMSDLATSCVRSLHQSGRVHGIVSAGGSGGTSLAASVMRNALPVGFPKLIVSTIASGDTGPIVGETDITLMYSVVDIAGLNSVLKTVLGNAGAAIAAMAKLRRVQCLEAPPQADVKAKEKKLKVGITMFGVTTPCVDFARTHLTQNYNVEVYVFHATGHGGRAMERLIAESALDAILDITTTEICDHLFGGNMSAGPQRLEAALKRGIPNILSLGATDMVNFGPREMVPERYGERKLLVHNASVTLMRTTGQECMAVGEFIVEKVRNFAKNESMVQVWIPQGGVSMIDVPGAPFEDQKTDAVLFESVRNGLDGTRVRVKMDQREINDKAFAVEMAEELMRLVRLSRGEEKN